MSCLPQRKKADQEEISLERIDFKHLFYLAREGLRIEFNQIMARGLGRNADLETYQEIERLAKRYPNRLQAAKMLACVAYGYEGYLDHAVLTYDDTAQLETIKKHLDRALKLYGEAQKIYEGRMEWVPNDHPTLTFEAKIGNLHQASQRLASLAEAGYVKGIDFLVDYARLLQENGLLQEIQNETESAISSGNTFIRQVMTDEVCICHDCQKGWQILAQDEQSTEILAVMDSILGRIPPDHGLVPTIKGYQSAVPFLDRLYKVREAKAIANQITRDLARLDTSADPREVGIAYMKGLGLIGTTGDDVNDGASLKQANLKDGIIRGPGFIAGRGGPEMAEVLSGLMKEMGIGGPSAFGGEFDNAKVNLRDLMERSASDPDEDLCGCGQPHGRSKIENLGKLKAELGEVSRMMGLPFSEDQIDELIRTGSVAINYPKHEGGRSSDR